MSILKPTRRMAVVKPPFDPVSYFLRMLTSTDVSVRFGAVYGLSMHTADPKVRLALRGIERGDTSGECRCAAKRVLDGNV